MIKSDLSKSKISENLFKEEANLMDDINQNEITKLENKLTSAMWLIASMTSDLNKPVYIQNGLMDQIMDRMSKLKQYRYIQSTIDDKTYTLRKEHR